MCRRSFYYDHRHGEKPFVKLCKHLSHSDVNCKPICPPQLMVAEKKGTIRFYDLLTQQAILSLDCGQSPLMSADWCLTNTIKVGAVVGNDWLIWDITRSR